MKTSRRKTVVMRCRRHGTTTLECAIVLPVLLFVLFAMLDLALAAVRYNALAGAAGRIAREAIVHGAVAPATSSKWGPTSFTGTAAAGSPIVASATSVLPTMAPADVSVHVTWPDDDNSPRDPVQVELSYTHRPIVPALSIWGPITLRATSTMNIVN